MMKRGKVILLVLGLFLVLSVVINSSLISAISTTPGGQTAPTISSFGTGFLSSLIDSWKTGNLDPMILKGILSIVIIFIIFSAFTSIQFPEQIVVRLILSVVIGFLSSVFIVPEEVYAVMSSYASLGIAITFFVPLFVLMAITFFSYKSGSSLGVLISRILWLIFGVYFLFLTLGVFAVHSATFTAGEKLVEQNPSVLFVFKNPGTADVPPSGFLKVNSGEQIIMTPSKGFSRSFIEIMTDQQFYRAYYTSYFMGFIMLIVSCFAIFVAFSRSLQAYVRGMVKRSLLENYLTDLELASESDKAKANIVKGKKNI